MPPWEEYKSSQTPGPWTAYNSSGRMSWGQAALSGAADAFTFGFGDELAGVFGGDTEASRRRQEHARMEQPGAFFTGQIGGSLVGGGGLSALARGAGLLRLVKASGPVSRILLATGAGAAGGAAYGAGDAGDDSRLQGALEMAPLGAVGGAFGQALFGEVAPKVFGGMFRGLSPEARAGDVVGKALQRFDIDDQKLLDNLQLQATLGGQVADLPSFYQLARGAGARPGVARDEFRTARDAMTERSGVEAIDDLWRTLAGRPVVVGKARRSAGEIVSEQADNMRARASPLYDEVDLGRVNPAQIPSEMRELMRRHPNIFGPAQERARAAMLSATGVDAIDETSPLYWRTLLSEARSEVSEGLRAAKFPGSPMGETRGYRGMGSARAAATIDHFSDFVRNLLGPKFREADNIWAGGRSFEDAVERGYESMKSSVNDLELSDVLRHMKRLQAQGRIGELEGMRLGALQRLSDNIENADPMTGRADALRGVMRNAGQRRIMLGLFTTGGKPPHGTPSVVSPGVTWSPKKGQYVRRRAGRKGGQAGPSSSLTAPIRLRDMNKLIQRLEDRQQQFRNTVQTGIEFNSITADKLAAYNSQLARTRPTPSNLMDLVWQTFTKDAADKYDEDVSNQILRSLNRPAIDVMTELRNVAGARPTADAFKRWSGGRGLLARGVRRRRELEEMAPRKLLDAITSGLYYPAAGAGVGEFGG